MKKFFSVRENFSFFHTAQCGKTRNSLSPKKISSNQLFSNLCSKTVRYLLSRNFAFNAWERERVRENPRNFHTVHRVSPEKTFVKSTTHCEKVLQNTIIIFTEKSAFFSVKPTFLLIMKLLMSWFHEFFEHNRVKYLFSDFFYERGTFFHDIFQKWVKVNFCNMCFISSNICYFTALPLCKKNIRITLIAIPWSKIKLNEW